MSGFFTTAVRELVRYKLDLIVVQEVRQDEVGTIWAGEFNFIFRKGNENQQLETRLLVHHS